MLFRLGITEAVMDIYGWAGGLATKLWAAAGVKLDIMMARVSNWYVGLGHRFDNRGAPSKLLYLFVKDQAEWAMRKADVSWGFAVATATAVAATTTAATYHCDSAAAATTTISHSREDIQTTTPHHSISLLIPTAPPLSCARASGV